MTAQCNAVDPMGFEVELSKAGCLLSKFAGSMKAKHSQRLLSTHPLLCAYPKPFAQMCHDIAKELGTRE